MRNISDAEATAMVARERDVIPANIAVPLSKLAKYCGMFPWLSYANGTLYSWKSKNENHEYVPNTLEDSEMISSVTGEREEVGFHMTHLFIGNYSGRIIKTSALMLEAVRND